MTMQSSGPISLLDIAIQYGGNAPYSMSNYYRGGGLVPSTSSNSLIATSGATDFQDFYGQGDKWRIITSAVTGTTQLLYASSSDGNIFVCVGAAGTIITSPTGTTWTTRSSGTTNVLTDIVYGNGLFVATGASGTIVTSPDGITWTLRSSGVSNTITKIAYGNGLFVATVYNTTIGYAFVITSSDGVSWTQRIVDSDTSSGWSPYLTPVTYGNGLYVVAGNAGRYQSTLPGYVNVTVIYTSPDTITWTERANSMGNSYYNTDLAYDPVLGFALVGASGIYGTYVTSTNGLTWTGIIAGGTTQTIPLVNVAAGPGSYFAVTTGSSGFYVYKGNNTSFSGSSILPSSQTLRGIFYDSVRQKYIACGANGVVAIANSVI